MNNASATKKCNVGEKLLEYDKFGSSFGMSLDQGKETLPSKMGTFCTFFLLIVLIAYTGYKINILEGKKSVDILQAVDKDHFDENDTFGSEQGLNIAVAVVNPFLQETFQPVDPRYGRIVFKLTEVGFNEEGILQIYSSKELESHQCSKEELGLLGTDHKFFPINRQQKSAFESIASAFLCVNQSELELYGGAKSGAKYQYITVDLVQCMGDDFCKSDDEIKKYFHVMQMLLLSNNIRFDQQKYGQDSIIMESSYELIFLGQWQSR